MTVAESTAENSSSLSNENSAGAAVRPNSTPAKLPPMLQQYLDYKERYPDALLMFQVGDFYEVFFADAVTISRTLNLTLTSRDKNSAEPIPMCGVPIAVIDGYLERLVAAGFSVAVVSQGAVPEKGMVPRSLERIVTPGIKVLGGVEAAPSEGYVAAVAGDAESELCVAFSSVQSGKIFVSEGIAPPDLATELGRLGVVEVVLPNTLGQQRIDRRLSWVRSVEQFIGATAVKFRSTGTGAEGSTVHGRALTGIMGFSVLSFGAKRAARLLLEFIDEITVSASLPIQSIELFHERDFVGIDVPTRRNLELVANSRDGSTSGTLYEYLNCTSCTAGGRLLRQWCVQPLRVAAEIRERLAAVRLLRAHSDVREQIRSALRGMVDFERLAARLELCAVTPRELGALRDSIARLPQIIDRLTAVTTSIEPESSLLRNLKDRLALPSIVAELLQRTLAENPPLTVSEGGILRDGFSAEVDALRTLKNEGHRFISALEGKERTESGISSLKIRFNNVIGYFFEVTKANIDKVPARFIRRQSTANGDRFTTEELKSLESEVLGAEGKLIALERALFESFRKELLTHSAEMRALGEQVATLDVLCSLAHLAERDSLCEPTIVEESSLTLTGAKHPILARILEERFVPNDLSFAADGTRCCIITGPNMGGKSTYLRQAALLCIMAQLGSFVPATAATIGVVDQIFARIGASDNLREGESTFMVEMREAANIAHLATESSLVLIDEIGRGTATADGLSIAQAMLEWLVTRTHSRTLFATHFHELTALDSAHPGVVNLSVASVETADGVLFTHQIQPGAAKRSYGVDVARLAGLPAGIVNRAEQLLRRSQTGAKEHTPQLSLFQPKGEQLFPERSDNSREQVSATKAPLATEITELIQRCQRVVVEQTTPLQALGELEGLVQLARRAADVAGVKP